ncbi:SIR2 family protein [Mesoplasma florum]|uniref:SIR2 family protein n=1 Tax=Mesoplasma florum TaxID=2151 RepID=UPI000D097BCB|nr:SIR2 family protein [Mesoplasma florum]AVN61120.1 hypothetical protein CG005_02375 [Mesoplasma florum]
MKKLDIINFERLVREIESENAIFFLGAGFSYNFNILSWQKFILKLLDQFIKILDENFYKELTFEKHTIQVKKSLSDLKENIINKEIKLDYAIDLFFNIIEFDQFNYSESKDKSESLKFQLIKNIYKDTFFVNEDYFYQNKIKNLKFLEYIRNKFKKIITTNFDNILFHDLSIDDQRYILNNSLEKWKSKEILDDWFFIPLHGNINFDYFDENSNESIWNNDFSLPIIDSFSSFKKNYGNEKKQQTKILEAVFERVMNENSSEIIIFFGYSFDDYFVSSQIFNILEKYKNIKYKKKKIYIISNNFEAIEFNELTRELGIGCGDLPLKQKHFNYSFISYLDIYSIFKFQINETSKFNKKRIELKNKISSVYKHNEFFFEDENSISKILFNFFINFNSFKEMSEAYHNSILDNISLFFEKTYEAKEASKKFTENALESLEEYVFWEDSFLFCYFAVKILEINANTILKFIRKNDEIINKNLYMYVLIRFLNEQELKNTEIISSFIEEHSRVLKSHNSQPKLFLKDKMLIENIKAEKIEIENQLFKEIESKW